MANIMMTSPDPPPDDDDLKTRAELCRELVALRATTAALTTALARSEAVHGRSKLEQLAWVPLKSIPRGTYSYESIRVWFHEGRIDASRVGRRLLSTHESVAKWLAIVTGKPG